eukprot:670-Pyramimonas_sp.AAC.1
MVPGQFYIPHATHTRVLQWCQDSSICHMQHTPGSSASAAMVPAATCRSTGPPVTNAVMSGGTPPATRIASLASGSAARLQTACAALRRKRGEGSTDIIAIKWGTPPACKTDIIAIKWGTPPACKTDSIAIKWGTLPACKTKNHSAVVGTHP